MAVPLPDTPSSSPNPGDKLAMDAANGQADEHATAPGDDAGAKAAAAHAGPDAGEAGTGEQQTAELESAEGAPLTIKVRPPDAEPYEVTVNPHASVLALRELFADDLSSKLCTSFSLTFNGQQMSESAELCEIEGIENGSVLVMKEEPYSEHGIRFHLVRFREVLDGARTRPFGLVVEPSISLISHVARGEGYLPPESPSGSRSSPKRSSPSGRRGSPTGTDPSQRNAFTTYDPDAPFSLASYIPPNFGKPSFESLEYIKVSPFNPPTRQRKLAGDLMYLLVKTYEGKEYNITGSVAGFYVNKSTDSTFDPRKAPSPPFHHTLPGLISRLSPIFKDKFARQLDEVASRPYLEVQPAFPELAPWALPAQQPSEDNGRLLDIYIQGIEQIEQPLMKDYHEEFQSFREQPKATAQDKVTRENQLHRVMLEFSDAATKAVVNIVEGNIPPLDPTMPEDRRVTIHNNMIFSQGPDSKESFEKIGGPEAWHVIMAKEVQGTKLINDLDVDGLHTMATAVVEYKGRRFVAQTLVPGFLTRMAAAPVIHGIVEEEKRIAWDEQMATIFDEVGKKLHLAQHLVKGTEGKDHVFRTSAETKGIKGCDGRSYILDLYRLQPVDIRFLEEADKDASNPYPHRLCLVRPEVVEQYWISKLRQHIVDKRAEKRAAMGVEEVKSKDEAGEKEEGAENEPEVLEITPEEEEEWMNSFEIYFNPDVFNPNVEQNLSEEQRVADEAQVRELSAYLHERIIPEFCQEFANAGAGIASSILDEEQLRETMHRRGINMRFLGTIAKIVRDLPANDTTRYLEDLLQHEMVIRAFKRVFGRVVGSTSSLLSVQASAHLLNCLLARGDARPAVPSGPEVPLSPAAKNTQNFAKYTRANLWSEIRAEVKARFRHDLPEDFAVTRVLPVIRSVCQRLGLQIASRKYDWTAANAQIFGSDDIVNIYPVNKVPWVRSSVGDDLLETARMALSQGQYKYGVELLQESVTAYDQTFGMVHPDVVRPLAMLAMIQSQANDKAEQDNSLQNQFKVVTILERTRGLDSHETVTGYLQLGIRTVETGDPVAGLNYLRHALELMEMLTCSRPHPELYSLYTKVGTTLLNALKDASHAKVLLERAIKTSEVCFGPEHPFTAYAHHNLAITHFLLNDMKEAMTEQKIAHRILSAKYGDTDKRVEEAYTWLKAFTEQAVESAKLQARAKVAASKPVAAPQPAAANAGTKIGAPGPKPKKGKGGRSAN